MKRRHWLKVLASMAAATPVATAARALGRRGKGTVLLQESPVAGFQFHVGERVWPRLAPGDALHLAREPRNRYGARAVAVRWHGHKLGYVPRDENTAIAQMLDRGERLEAEITGLRRSPNPWRRVRVAVRVVV